MPLIVDPATSAVSPFNFGGTANRSFRIEGDRATLDLNRYILTKQPRAADTAIAGAMLRYNNAHLVSKNPPRIMMINVVNSDVSTSIFFPSSYRVAVLDDETLTITAFGPNAWFSSGEVHHVEQSAAPSWIVERICVLRIGDNGTIIKGVGLKLTDRIYYLAEPTEETDDNA